MPLLLCLFALLFPVAAIANEAIVVGQSPEPPVFAFADAGFEGESQGFPEGEYRISQQEFGYLAGDSVSSIRVKKGWLAIVCDRPPDDGTGAGLCTVLNRDAPELGGLNDAIGYIRIEKL